MRGAAASQSLQCGVERSEIHSGEMYRLGMCVYINFTVFLAVLGTGILHICIHERGPECRVGCFVYLLTICSQASLLFVPARPRFVVWIPDILVNPGAPRPTPVHHQKALAVHPSYFCRGFSKVKMFLNGPCYGARYGATHDPAQPDQQGFT